MGCVEVGVSDADPSAASDVDAAAGGDGLISPPQGGDTLAVVKRCSHREDLNGLISPTLKLDSRLVAGATIKQSEVAGIFLFCAENLSITSPQQGAPRIAAHLDGTARDGDRARGWLADCWVQGTDFSALYGNACIALDGNGATFGGDAATLQAGGAGGDQIHT